MLSGGFFSISSGWRIQGFPARSRHTTHKNTLLESQHHVSAAFARAIRPSLNLLLKTFFIFRVRCASFKNSFSASVSSTKLTHVSAFLHRINVHDISIWSHVNGKEKKTVTPTLHYDHYNTLKAQVIHKPTLRYTYSRHRADAQPLCHTRLLPHCSPCGSFGKITPADRCQNNSSDSSYTGT